MIAEGGWENKDVIGYFKNYCAYVVSNLGNLMEYVCTINEANMGLQVAGVAKDIMRRMGITPQIGMNFEELMARALPADRLRQKKEIAGAFGLDDPNGVHDFLSMRTDAGDLLIMQAHAAAREAMKTVCPHLRSHSMTFSPSPAEKESQSRNGQMILATICPIFRRMIL